MITLTTYRNSISEMIGVELDGRRLVGFFIDEKESKINDFCIAIEQLVASGGEVDYEAVHSICVALHKNTK